MTTSDLDTVTFGLYDTAGGGLARKVVGLYVWHEVPDEFPYFKIGTEIPREWGVMAANKAAYEEVRREEEGDDLNDADDDEYAAHLLARRLEML